MYLSVWRIIMYCELASQFYGHEQSNCDHGDDATERCQNQITINHMCGLVTMHGWQQYGAFVCRT